MEIVTRNDKETKKIGEALAREVLKEKSKKPSFAKASEGKHALVISLEGALGAGKTTFTQGFAKGLGIKENPRSPTFVLMRIYQIKNKNLKNFIHIDAYRIKSKDFKVFGWKSFIKNQNNIILVEWGNKIKNILPKNSLRIIFKHGKNQNLRRIRIVGV